MAGRSAMIYLDESGDLGWKFDAPYRQGGSSRYLTISALCVPAQLRHLPRRTVRDLYQRFRWPTTNEKKWSAMCAEERLAFAKAAKELCEKYSEICLHAIVVKKQNVLPHIQKDSNKLYNYMTRLVLVDRMAEYDEIRMVPDDRSIRVKSGNSLHDYLQTTLWFEKKVGTTLVTQSADSATSLAVQFTDMLAGTVQASFEDHAGEAFRILHPHLSLVRLFF